jgi:hypothetical protein
MTLIKAMRRRNEALHSVSVNTPSHQRARSQERMLQDNKDDYFEKLEKRYLSYSTSSTSTDTEDDSQVTTPPFPHAMTDPLVERKHFEFDESFPTLARFPVSSSGDKHCWSEPNHDIYAVRGSNYLQDQQKVESGPFLLRARGCDLLLSPDGCEPPKHVGRCVECLLLLLLWMCILTDLNVFSKHFCVLTFIPILTFTCLSKGIRKFWEERCVRFPRL